MLQRAHARACPRAGRTANFRTGGPEQHGTRLAGSVRLSLFLGQEIVFGQERPSGFKRISRLTGFASNRFRRLDPLFLSRPVGCGGWGGLEEKSK